LGIEWIDGELWQKILYISIYPVGWGFDIDSAHLYVLMPAGAILFLLLRRRLQRLSAPAIEIGTDMPTTTSAAERA
jgi:hypothetical protein